MGRCHGLVHEDHGIMVRFNIGKVYSDRRDDPSKPISRTTPL
jgi:hypothetical protein